MQLRPPKSDFESIRKLHLFAEIEDAAFEALMRGAYIQSFPPQIELIEQGDSSSFLHIVVSGSVDLFATWDGHESSMATVRPVSTFILAATINDAPYLMSARTLEKSRIVLVPSEDVRSVFNSDAGFARAIVSELAHSYRSVIKNAKNLKLRTSLERLANYLLRRQLEAGGVETFEFDLEKRRLASFLGMTPENLSRAIKGLQPYGVTVDGSRIRITDRAHLERFAKPSPLIDDYSI